jgi:uncharacterized protein
MTSRTLAILARSPRHDPATIKTRLAARLPRAEDRAALYRAFLADTLSLARRVPGVAVRVCVTPAGAGPAFRELGVQPGELRPQRAGDLGDRQRGVFEDLFAEGAGAVVLIGSDLPGLPSTHVAQAFHVLEADRAAVVLGPSDDGGYYLVGLATGAGDRALVPPIFERIRWSTRHALDDTIEAAGRAARRVALAPRWFDVDDGEGLDRLEALLRAPEVAARAPATVAALEALRRGHDR